MNVIIVTDRTIYATWLSKCFQFSSIVRTDSQGPLNFFCDGLVTFQSPSHYNDVIMGAIASQITSLTIVYSIQTQIKENTKAPRHWPLGNSPGTGEFPAQMASYAENVSIWWRHHGSEAMLIQVIPPNAVTRDDWVDSIIYIPAGTRIGGLVTRLWRAHFKGQRSRPALICRWGLIHMQQESRTCATDVSAATSARRHIVYRQPHDRTDYSEKRRDVWKVRTEGAWCRHLGWHRPWCRAWGVYGQWHEWSRCCCGWYSVRTTERRRQWERLS